MLLNLLTNALPQGYKEASIPEAALYALIGFMVVFAGIAFLVFVVWLVGLLMEKAKAAVNAKPAKPAAITPTGKTVLSQESDEVDEETIAVITAAVMAYYQQNNPKCEFTVKRIKRVRRNDYA